MQWVAAESHIVGSLMGIPGFGNTYRILIFSLSQLLHQSYRYQRFLHLLNSLSKTTRQKRPQLLLAATFRLILNSFCLDCFLHSEKCPTLDPRNLNKQRNTKDGSTNPEKESWQSIPEIPTSPQNRGSSSEALTLVLF
jgi:hypothetical protein